MFKPNTALYLASISAGVETIDQETRKILLLDWTVQPFTRELADDLGIASELFESGSGNPNDLIVSCKLRIAVPLQRLTLRMVGAPDGAGRLFENVEIDKTIRVRSDKEGPVLAATITTTMRYPSGDDLLYIMTGYRDQHACTFEAQQGGLLDNQETDKKPRRVRKPNGAAEGESAQA